MGNYGGFFGRRMKEGLMEEMAFEMSLNVSKEFHWFRLQKTWQAKVKKLRQKKSKFVEK